MIVLFPLISFQSLLFSIVDAGKVVGGVEAVNMWKKSKQIECLVKKEINTFAMIETEN